ncbi:hypothetical protein HHI36_021092 [Cryptolaemus montrouzieri]|uniref:Scavenger receptor class B member 1 n=1 Tax=Cryptolaemus montrouzieri TaxID=559131 RepID=A0ABD2MVW1_9CUCU
MFQNIYPDLQYAEKPQAISQKERNVKQFFPKTTKLTKDFIGKVNISKFAKSDTYVFGDEWRNSRLLIITGLLILFLTSFFGIIFMWYTDGFNNIIYSNLVITEGSPAFEMWRNPTPKPLVKVYIFNYTNVDRYEEGIDTKLNVEEKGPYVYEDTMERINIKFNGSYVSYQVKRSYRFVPELSNGRQNDIVVVPNMLMLGIAGVHRYSNFFTRLTISGGLNGYYAKPFIRIAADRYIIGYDDELYTLSKSVMRFQDKKPADKLGLLSLKVGENPDVYTMHTGLGDIDQIGTIKSWNGKTHFGYWSTKGVR